MKNVVLINFLSLHSVLFFQKETTDCFCLQYNQWPQMCLDTKLFADEANLTKVPEQKQDRTNWHWLEERWRNILSLIWAIHAACLKMATWSPPVKWQGNKAGWGERGNIDWCIHLGLSVQDCFRMKYSPPLGQEHIDKSNMFSCCMTCCD